MSKIYLLILIICALVVISICIIYINKLKQIHIAKTLRYKKNNIVKVLSLLMDKEADLQALYRLVDDLEMRCDKTTRYYNTIIIDFLLKEFKNTQPYLFDFYIEDNSVIYFMINDKIVKAKLGANVEFTQIPMCLFNDLDHFNMLEDLLPYFDSFNNRYAKVQNILEANINSSIPDTLFTLLCIIFIRHNIKINDIEKYLFAIFGLRKNKISGIRPSKRHFMFKITSHSSYFLNFIIDEIIKINEYGRYLLFVFEKEKWVK